MVLWEEKFKHFSKAQSKSFKCKFEIIPMKGIYLNLEESSRRFTRGWKFAFST